MDLFVDWFNPRGNKKAGKLFSMGVISLNCLNLLPTTRRSISNSCIMGITPGPNEPSMVTINHVLKLLVDELLVLRKGITLKTHQFPEGRNIHVKILGLLGDVVATHKVAGFSSHSGSKFCSFCDCTLAEKDEMVLDLSQKRTKAEVLSQAERWAKAKTVTQKDKLVTNYGV
ncbi:hypothetical protein CROQUDRAFT_686991 [Cronartium quercuum f. sp. fusiforme G11]|uniref:Uncharacterized protein n=1 Tax=Cronartium quercuum f. sp. fusiforme G11 TaxID=708437 RepID=A0A9P6NBQ4_9BASI|nr:hypothetical protein CROQUDRAFT_686991 [Cronartium quercuum f. sp. fusiforme G11]